MGSHNICRFVEKSCLIDGVNKISKFLVGCIKSCLKFHTLTTSFVTSSKSMIRGITAGSPHRWSSSEGIPNRARVKECPLVLHPTIFKITYTKEKKKNSPINNLTSCKQIWTKFFKNYRRNKERTLLNYGFTFNWTSNTLKRSET